MSAISAHFIYIHIYICVYFVRLRLLCCNARCQKAMKETSDGGCNYLDPNAQIKQHWTVKLDAIPELCEL